MYMYTLKAAHTGALETLHWLLEAGCPVDACDGEYVTRCICAYGTYKGS